MLVTDNGAQFVTVFGGIAKLLVHKRQEKLE